MIGTTEFRSGLRIEVEGEPYLIVEFQHVKPGKGGAFVRTTLKHLKTGNTLNKTFRSGEVFEAPDLEEKSAQYLYTTEGHHHFMDLTTYEQFFLSAEQLGPSRNFLKETMNVKILFYRGQPITVDLPIFVELRVVETDLWRKGATASGGSKPATLETGAVVKVPAHINVGDLLRIDTRDGTYVERA